MSSLRLAALVVGLFVVACSGTGAQPVEPEDVLVSSGHLGDAGVVAEAIRDAEQYFAKAGTGEVPLPDDSTDITDSPYVAANLLIVSSHPSFAAALRAAETFSRESGIAYESRGLVFDEKRGLIWPDDDADEIWAGQYAPRRYDDCGGGDCVTVERSDGYEGFEPGFYIVVAGITRSGPELRTRLAAIRRHAPDATFKQTILYMGCMH